jgi:hypothetical protein
VLLADECWLIAHDDTTGRSLLAPRLAGVAAASGLLCELLYARIITADKGLLAVRDRKPSPDLLQHSMTDLLLRENHPIETWLRFFARTAEEDIATRLIRQGIVQESRGRRLLSRGRRHFVPTASPQAAWPAARLAKRLAQARPVDATDQILIGWIDATGLTGHVLWDDPQRLGARYIEHVVAHLPTEYRLLCDETKTLVGQIVMTHRT